MSLNDADKANLEAVVKNLNTEHAGLAAAVLSKQRMMANHQKEIEAHTARMAAIQATIASLNNAAAS